MSTAGFAVAGGQSSRMGRDKALLPFEGGTLLDHAIARLRLMTDTVHILCGPTRRYEDRGVPVIEDAICGAGPIGGLYSALALAHAAGHEQTIWLAIDLPLVPVSVLNELNECLDGADVAIARTQSGLEPLCAAFRTEPCLDAVRTAVLTGRLKISDALAGLKRHEVQAETAFFANINSPADYAHITPAVLVSRADVTNRGSE